MLIKRHDVGGGGVFFAAGQRSRLRGLAGKRVGGHSDYWLSVTGWPGPGLERRRWQLLERLWDPLTVRRLRRLGVRAGGAVLRVGAGAGSIVRWLRDAVDPSGRVLATDISIRACGGAGRPYWQPSRCAARRSPPEKICTPESRS